MGNSFLTVGVALGCVFLSTVQSVAKNSKEKVSSTSCAAQLPEQSDSVREIFEKGFNDRAMYSAGKCDWNIARFIGELQKKKISVAGGSVLYLIGPSGMPVRQYRHPLAEWPYHSVLALGGSIYDFDFTTKPTILSMNEYLEQNILGEEAAKVLKVVSVLSVPASEFVLHFPKTYSRAQVKRFQEWLERNYSFQSLEDFLR